MKYLKIKQTNEELMNKINKQKPDKLRLRLNKQNYLLSDLSIKKVGKSSAFWKGKKNSHQSNNNSDYLDV